MTLSFLWALFLVYQIGFVVLLNNSDVSKEDKIITTFGTSHRFHLLVLGLQGIGLTFLCMWYQYLAPYYTSTKKEAIVMILFMYYVVYSQFTLAAFTDHLVHRVDRFINRFGYFTSIVLSVLFIVKFSENAMWLIVSLVGLLLLLVILFFGITSVGEADFRIMAIIFPILLAIDEHRVIISIACVLFTTAFYQFLIQFKNGNKHMSVPIGHIMLLSTQILIGLTLFY